MSSAIPSPYTHIDRLCDLSKGTGYCFGSAGAGLTLTIIASAIAAFAAATLFGIVIFASYYAYSNPIQLAWAIPLEIGLIIVNCFFIKAVLNRSMPTIVGLAERASYFGVQMLKHYGRALS